MATDTGNNVGEWVRVAALDEIPVGAVLRVELPSDDIAIFNMDGELFAIGDTCTHAQASLSDGDFYDNIVECPLHGSAFDVTTGAAMQLPAMGNAGKYEVRVEDDEVYVNTEAVVRRRMR